MSLIPTALKANVGHQRQRGWSWISAALSRHHQSIWFALLLFAVLTAVVAAAFVKDLRHPLFGRGDFDQWPYQGYYLATHFQFTPLPQLDFHNDDVFYPYGVSNVFRPWNFESAYAYAIGYQLFGHGPWLQWYFVASVFLCAVLVYLVVSQEFGARWALFAGFVLAFANFPAISRYPDHFGYATVHWMTLSILLDFVLVRRYVRRIPITFRLLLLKATAQTLCFGHDLGYICGLSLTSTTISVLWVMILATLQGRLSIGKWREQCSDIWRHAKASATQHRGPTMALATVLLLASFLYVPLTWQVLGEARANGSSNMAGDIAAEDELNFITPILPPFCSTKIARWHDALLFRFRPGIFLVIGGLGGLVLGWRHRNGWMTAMPFAILLLTILFFDQTAFNWARWFPWWQMALKPDRFGVFIPVALVCFMTLAPGRAWWSRNGRTVVVCAVSLCCAECATAYYYLIRYVHRPDIFQRDVLHFTEVVSQTPGKAVMDWPFKIQAGNHLDNPEFDYYHRCLIHSPFLQAFHHKKSVGGYFGRLHPDQIQPFVRAGWQWLFLPENQRPAFQHRPRQHRNFTVEEWDFLERFYRLHDFCGIILYTNLLPPATVQGFHQRFGEPAVTANVPRAGRTEFIPKPANWRGEVNVVAGQKLQFKPPTLLIAQRQSVSFSRSDGDAFLKSGWSHAEPAGRWSQGPVAELAFSLGDLQNHRLVLDLEIHALSGQPFQVVLNGQHLRTVRSPPNRMAHFRMKVPREAVLESNLLQIEMPEADISREETSEDRQQLGIQLKSLSYFLE